MEKDHKEITTSHIYLPPFLPSPACSLMQFLPRLFLVFFLLIAGNFARAQAPRTNDGLKQPRILILLDGSSSMLQPWGQGEQRFAAAGKIVLSLMDSLYHINGAVEFALRVYGHEHPAQEQFCYDSRLEVNFSKDNYTQMQLRLASLRPRGVSPIAWSLQQAAENDLTNDLRNAYSIILITDGGESCNGDICKIVSSLLAKKIFFKPYILSLVESPVLKDQYNCLGNYLQVAKEGDIGPAIHNIAELYRPMLTLPQMAIKPMQMLPVTPPPPKPIPAQKPDATAVAVIPKWIGEKANLDNIAIKYQQKTLSNSYTLPRPHAHPNPACQYPESCRAAAARSRSNPAAGRPKARRADHHDRENREDNHAGHNDNQSAAAALAHQTDGRYLY